MNRQPSQVKACLFSEFTLCCLTGSVEAVEEPEDTFVEDTVVRLLVRLNIPLPEWLAG
ncbi:hypothetical protein ABIE35_001023 [Paenarthrobacter sp. 4246]